MYDKEMSLDQTAIHAGDPLETPTEEAVFEALGLDYLEPEDRDSWHRLKVEAARRRGV